MMMNTIVLPFFQRSPTRHANSGHVIFGFGAQDQPWFAQPSPQTLHVVGSIGPPVVGNVAVVVRVAIARLADADWAVTKRTVVVHRW
jgi:hypothetical protein